MKKTKRLLAILGISMIAVSAFSLPASAANTSDTSYTFNFNWIGQANTSGRAKQNASSTYIKCNQLPNGGFQVYVDGATSSTGSWTDRTIGQPKVTRTGEFLINQLVYESGERYARLGGYCFMASQSAKGYWSPDSVGSYPVLNP